MCVSDITSSLYSMAINFAVAYLEPLGQLHTAISGPLKCHHPKSRGLMSAARRSVYGGRSAGAYSSPGFDHGGVKRRNTTVISRREMKRIRPVVVQLWSETCELFELAGRGCDCTQICCYSMLCGSLDDWLYLFLLGENTLVCFM